MMRAIVKTILEHRTLDKYGDGYFGAPRGKRTHNGIDYIVKPECRVLSPCVGKVTKLGYAYADDLSFRYVQITDNDGLKHRVFYVDPILPMGREVNENTVIGHAQNLDDRYPGITPHIHYEVKKGSAFINPEKI